MARITISPEARRDLIAIHTYICNELCNPSAAQRIMGALKTHIRSLQDFPGKGRPLDALISVHTEYRYLVCESYCIFYLGDERDIVIVRILHQRQDYIRALLPIK